MSDDGQPRQEADELTQEAFVRVILKRWSQVWEMVYLKGYLYRTSMNLFRKRCRREAVLSKLPGGRRTRDDAFAEIDQRDALVRALRELPRRGNERQWS